MIDTHTVFEGTTAVSALAIFFQLHLARCTRQFDSCRHLHESFAHSEDLKQFRAVVKKSIGSPSAQEELVTALSFTNGDDRGRRKTDADRYFEFFRYVYYAIDKRFIRPDDVARILGPAIKELENLRKEIETRCPGCAALKQFPVLPPKLQVAFLKMGS